MSHVTGLCWSSIDVVVHLIIGAWDYKKYPGK